MSDSYDNFNTPIDDGSLGNYKLLNLSKSRGDYFFSQIGKGTFSDYDDQYNYLYIGDEPDKDDGGYKQYTDDLKNFSGDKNSKNLAR
jgi:hypothetical protein